MKNKNIMDIYGLRILLLAWSIIFICAFNVHAQGMYDAYNKITDYQLSYSDKDYVMDEPKSYTGSISKSIFTTSNYGIVCFVKNTSGSTDYFKTNYKYLVSIAIYSDTKFTSPYVYSVYGSSGIYIASVVSYYSNSDTVNTNVPIYKDVTNNSDIVVSEFATSVKNNSLSSDDQFQPNVSNPINDSNSSYQKDIGYLQNLAMHSRYNQTTNVQSDYFTFDAKTNTNYDVTSSNVKVSCYTKLHCYYFTNSFQWITKKPGGETVSPNYLYYGSVDGSDLKINTIANDIYGQHKAEFENAKKLNTALFITPIQKIEYYFRIEEKQVDGTWKYSGWVKIADGNASYTEGNKTTTGTTPDGTVDNNSGYNGGTPTTDDSGQGKTDEEADASAKHLPDSQNEASEDGKNALNTFVGTIKGVGESIGEVPQLIGNVIQFIPSPIIALIGAGFGLAVILRIIGR